MTNYQGNIFLRSDFLRDNDRLRMTTQQLQLPVRCSECKTDITSRIVRNEFGVYYLATQQQLRRLALVNKEARVLNFDSVHCSLCKTDITSRIVRNEFGVYYLMMDDRYQTNMEAENYTRAADCGCNYCNFFYPGYRSFYKVEKSNGELKGNDGSITQSTTIKTTYKERQANDNCPSKEIVKLNEESIEKLKNKRIRAYFCACKKCCKVYGLVYYQNDTADIKKFCPVNHDFVNEIRLAQMDNEITNWSEETRAYYCGCNYCDVFYPGTRPLSHFGSDGHGLFREPIYICPSLKYVTSLARASNVSRDEDKIKDQPKNVNTCEKHDLVFT